MKKRLRKKLHIGEFKQCCFIFRSGYSTTDEDSLWSRFADKITELGLLCTGIFGNGTVDLCFEAGIAASGDEERHLQLLDWVKTQPEFSNPEVSGVFDGYYGQPEF